MKKKENLKDMEEDNGLFSNKQLNEMVASMQRKKGKSTKVSGEEEPRIVRIGKKWYTYDQDLNKYNETSRTELASDFGKHWEAYAVKYAGYFYEPSYLDYKKVIKTKDDTYLNQHQPVKWDLVEGQWPTIESALRHLFQDKYELILDYLKVLITEPKHPLPIVCLVGPQDTGKSWFMDGLLATIFGENTVSISAEAFNDKFNIHWATKNIIMIDETETEDYQGRNDLAAKLKRLTTTNTTIVERKGVDATKENFYGKVVVASNREKSFLKIEKADTRYWISKVPSMPESQRSKDFLQKTKSEIPCFLHWIINVKEMPERKGRMWLDPKDYRTKALEEAADFNKSVLVHELTEVLTSWFETPIVKDPNSYDYFSLKNSSGALVFPETWRFGITELNDLLIKNNFKRATTKWLKQCLTEEMGKTEQHGYFGPTKSTKRGYDFHKDEFLKCNVTKPESKAVI